MTTMRDFIRNHRVALSAEWTATNPHMDDAGKMDNWKCQIRAGRKSMTVYFSKGRAHGGKEPTACEVLDCLASDAAGAENAQSFEDWCSEYDYDTDSRKAERTFRTIEKQAAGLKRLLGDDGYRALLWDTERL